MRVEKATEVFNLLLRCYDRAHDSQGARGLCNTVVVMISNCGQPRILRRARGLAGKRANLDAP